MKIVFCLILSTVVRLRLLLDSIGALDTIGSLDGWTLSELYCHYQFSALSGRDKLIVPFSGFANLLDFVFVVNRPTDKAW